LEKRSLELAVTHVKEDEIIIVCLAKSDPYPFTGGFPSPSKIDKNHYPISFDNIIPAYPWG
jgi:hypothetical protein